MKHLCLADYFMPVNNVAFYGHDHFLIIMFFSWLINGCFSSSDGECCNPGPYHSCYEVRLELELGLGLRLRSVYLG